MNPSDISRILDKVGDVRAQEPAADVADNYAPDQPAQDSPALADTAAAEEEIVQVRRGNSDQELTLIHYLFCSGW